MKNVMYISFLTLMAVTYLKVVENYSELPIEILKNKRAPASVENIILNECEDLPQSFNPHYIIKMCK